MKARDVVKTAGGLVVGAGVGTIMSGAIGIAAPVAGMCLLAKGVTLAGGFVLSSMIQEKTTDYFEEKVDEVCDAIEDKDTMRIFVVKK